MVVLRSIVMISILLCCETAFAQKWLSFTSVEDQFHIMVPGEFQVETAEIETEYGIVVPSRIYSAENANGRYSITVVDYRNALKLHQIKIEENGGLYLPIYAEVDVRGAVAFATKKIRNRASSVEYDAYHYIDRIDGHTLQTTNPDGTRTFAAIYMHESRLYISEATVVPDTAPPAQFQQSLEFIDENGELIRYKDFRDVYKVQGAAGG